MADETQEPQQKKKPDDQDEPDATRNTKWFEKRIELTEDPAPKPVANGAVHDEAPAAHEPAPVQPEPTPPAIPSPPPPSDWRLAIIEKAASEDLASVPPRPAQPAPVPTPVPEPAPASSSASPTAAPSPFDPPLETPKKPSPEPSEAQEPESDAKAGAWGRLRAAFKRKPAEGTGVALPEGITEEAALKGLREQEKARLRKELEEAHELEARAEEARKRLRERRKLQAGLSKQARLAQRLAERTGVDPNRPVTDIPPLQPDHKQVDLTAVVPDTTYIRISQNTKTGRYLYEVIEPVLSDTERGILDFLRETLVATLDTPKGVDADSLRAELIDAVETAIVDHAIVLDDVSRKRVEYYLVRDILGLGTIDPLMKDGQIEDISCLGPNIPLYLFHRKHEAVRTNVVFKDAPKLDSFVIWLAQRSGKQISVAEPILDATLPDKSRLQTTLAREVTPRGSSFTIRKFRSDPLTPPDLVNFGSLSPRLAAFFWFLMEEGMSIVYAGGTASGKTSLLNAVSIFIPPQKKIVSIEDTREINLPHENWISGLTRAGFGGEIVGGKVAGSIDMYKLLEAALRQRPEYILVGEVRGSEALTLFQAMATGHATYSTLHAESPAAAVNRIESPPINVPRVMLGSLGAIVIQAQVRMKGRMVRRIKEVSELVGIDEATKELVMNTAFEWDVATDEYVYTGRSHLLEQIGIKKNLTGKQITAEWDRRTKVIDHLAKRKIRAINDVMGVIANYYSDPEGTLKLLEETAPSAPVAPPAMPPLPPPPQPPTTTQPPTNGGPARGA